MEYDIYDPSNTVGSRCWQIGDAACAVDKEDWQTIANLINQGLPEREEIMFRCSEPEQKKELWGCVRGNNSFWIYRFFFTGRDNFGRPGRYFFILFKLKSMDELEDSSVYMIIDYLLSQKNIPIDVENLAHLPCDSSKSRLVSQALIKSIKLAILKISKEGHYGWCIVNNKIIQEYKDLPAFVSSSHRHIKATLVDQNSLKHTSTKPLSKDNSLKEIRKKRNYFIGLICFAILVAIVVCVVYLWPKINWLSKKPQGIIYNIGIKVSSSEKNPVSRDENVVLKGPEVYLNGKKIEDFKTIEIKEKQGDGYIKIKHIESKDVLKNPLSPQDENTQKN